MNDNKTPQTIEEENEALLEAMRRVMEDTTWR